MQNRTNLSPGKKVLATTVLAATALVGVAGVAAAAPKADGAGQQVVTLPKELRSQQGDDQKADFAFHKSVKLRVINETRQDIEVRDYNADTKVLSQGEHYDVSGWSFWSGHPDVQADLSLRGGSIAKVWGYNPEVGWPSVGVNGDWDRYGVGETKTKDPGVGFKVKITRQADEDMKLFTVEVIR